MTAPRESRSTADLVRQLMLAARGKRQAAIVVHFPSQTDFVRADDEAALETLNEMVRDGGQPMAFIYVSTGSGGLSEIGAAPLAEYRGQAWAEEYIADLVTYYRKQIERDGGIILGGIEATDP